MKSDGIFAAIGSGGKSLEELIETGFINGVFDLVTHEVACYLSGSLCDAGPSQLEAAGRKGIPRLIIPGKVDIISFSGKLGPPHRVQTSLSIRSTGHEGE